MTLLLIGGVWADRLPRQRVMIATDLVRATLHALLAVLILTGGATIWQLVVIEACYGAAQAFFQPAYTGLVPQTVPEELNLDARALTEWIANLASLVGPALATLLVLGVGAGEAFAFDAATFVFSALMLARVHPRRRGRQTRAESLAQRAAGRLARGALAGLGVGHDRRLLGRVAAHVRAVVRARPGIARDHYGGAGVFGVLETVAGIGAVCARAREPALAAVPSARDRPGAVPAVAAGVRSVRARRPAALVIPCSFGTGWGFGLMIIWWETALARHIPPNLLSRVSAYDWMGSLALLPLGYALAGPLAEAFGAQTVLGVGSLIGLAALLLALLPRSTRELTEPPATARGAPRRAAPGAPRGPPRDLVAGPVASLRRCLRVPSDGAGRCRGQLRPSARERRQNRKLGQNRDCRTG